MRSLRQDKQPEAVVVEKEAPASSLKDGKPGGGRIFIDHLPNQRGATAVLPDVSCR
jgi:DNA primase